MGDLKKPIDSIQLATSIVALTKTALVVLAMMLLEWSRLKERRATIEVAAAKTDLEIQKFKTEAAADARTDTQVIDDFLGRAPPGVPNDGQG